MKHKLNEPLVVEPSSGEADAAVIWLHGLGASGHDFEPVIPHLNIESRHRVRFIFPHAPNRAVTVNGGMEMPAWYDILSMDNGRVVNTEHLDEAAGWVQDLISTQQDKGVAPERIVVIGFSQGGAVAYRAALSASHTLGGLMALSTYFVEQGNPQISAANTALPVVVMHGTADMAVHPAMADQAVASLQSRSISPEQKWYEMDHSVCLTQIRDIGRYLNLWLS